MKTIITHFYNEEYLLPWWLKHHKKYFDHGILVDYGSTDNSVEIIKSICPTWEIIPSVNQYFDARECDKEIEEIERRVTGWRIAITVTEFLVGDIDSLAIESNERIQWTIPCVVFTGFDPNGTLDSKRPLWDQIKMGLPYTTRPAPASPCRSLHNYNDIVYDPGRHFWTRNTENVVTFKYSNCLIGKPMIDRRLQIKEKISEQDKTTGISEQHVYAKGGGLTLDNIHQMYKETIEIHEPVDCSDIINRVKPAPLFLRSRKDYSIFLISNKPDRFEIIQECLQPELLHYFDGTGYPSFAKLVNECVATSLTEIVIIMGDKVRPKPKDIETTLTLLDRGYGLVGLYRFGFFGFKKELLRKLGMFDERYVGGGHEDLDFIFRMIKANIASFFTEDVEYIKSESSWNYDMSFKFYKQKWREDWDRQANGMPMFIKTMPEEKYDYDLGPSVPANFLSNVEHTYCPNHWGMFFPAPISFEHPE